MTGGRVVQHRELGQHFLADENILGVIGRLAELEADDVVLEIGAGLGVLTAFLAGRVRHVHAIELDRGLEAPLRASLHGSDNVSLLIGDAMRLSFDPLSPAPGKLVANLPYSIATPLCVESLDRLPTVRLWCVMLQREVAERFVAAPGTAAYGAVSVLVQLTCVRSGFHPVARTCFRPPPNVDSALLALRRCRDWGAEYAALKRLVQAAFAHRRKTLANSLDLSGLCPRATASAALGELGLSPGVRAEAVVPPDYVRLAELLT